MGLSSKKSKTTETSTRSENIAQTRTNPAWAEDALKGFTGKVTGLLDRDPQDFIAGPNALQTQAGAAASNLGGWRAGIDAATDMAQRAGNATINVPGVTAAEVGSRDVSTGSTGRVGASSLLENLDAYMSPYREQVVDTALTDFDVDAGRTRAAQAAAGARNNAFGGSRFGVREAQTEGELSRARATTDATLRNQMFETGAGLSNLDAGRRQEAALANQRTEAQDLERRLTGDISNADRTLLAQAGNADRSLDAATGNADRSVVAQTADLDRMVDAGGLMGQLAEAAGAGARSDIGTQLDAGGALRDVANQQAQAPLGLLGAVGDLLGQGQFDLFNGTNTAGLTNSTGTSVTKDDPSLMAKIGQAVQLAAQAAAMSGSDRDLKTEIETEGYDDFGRRWVSWRYLWEPEGHPRHLGVIAQEVRESDPDAVAVGPMGFLMVDYSKLENGPWRHS